MIKDNVERLDLFSSRNMKTRNKEAQVTQGFSLKDQDYLRRYYNVYHIALIVIVIVG
jgi:hypothetical protein